MALTREDLNRMQCGHPKCTHQDHGVFFLKGRCHQQAPTGVGYVGLDREVHVHCRVCSKFIAAVAVRQDLADIVVCAVCPDLGVWVTYDQKTGLLSMKCVTCLAVIQTVAVATKRDTRVRQN